MPIIWRDAMSVGNDIIDRDHKELIEIVNEFEATIAKGVNPKVIHALAQSLWDYCNTHFMREEQLQIACNYPFHEAHKREHKELLDSVKDTIRRYFVDKTDQVDEEAARKIAAFLKNWLVEHIIKSDLRLKPYLARAGKMDVAIPLRRG